MHPVDTLLTDDSSDQVGRIGESALIRELLACLGSARPPPPRGPGDDCAVLPTSRRRRLVTADPVICNQHFLPHHPPESVARKLVRRNLSDIAAMGGQPEAAVLSVALPRRTSLRWLKRFFCALGRESIRFKFEIIGGDCSASEGPPGFFMTLLALSVGRRILTRTGAEVGEGIYVTGRLGGSLLGHQFQFEPRLAEGAWLAGRREVSAMIDLSDGLAKDLPELLPHETGAVLDGRRIPLSKAAETRAKETGRSSIHHALTDGEDFELLFTVSRKTDLEHFENDWHRTFNTPLSRIGRIVSSGNSDRPVTIDHGPEDLYEARGYEHFR